MNGASNIFSQEDLLLPQFEEYNNFDSNQMMD
jgi:hypothetical protein